MNFGERLSFASPFFVNEVDILAEKTFVPDGQAAPASQIGATLEALSHTIEQRRSAGAESYTYRLLVGELDKLLKKVSEESLEVCLAAKELEQMQRFEAEAAACDAAVNHMRYEAADVVYHLMVLLERMGIGLDEFAAELNTRMTDAERPKGALSLKPEYVNRGK